MQIRELDQASLMAVSQTLPVRKANNLQGYTDQLESSANEMLDKIEPLRAAAKSEAENLGHSVNQMVSVIYYQYRQSCASILLPQEYILLFGSATRIPFPVSHILTFFTCDIGMAE